MADPNVSNLSSVFDDEDGKEEDEAKKTEVNGNKRKASNLVHGLAINFKDSASDFEEEEGDKPIVKKAKTVTNKETSKPKAKKGKAGKIDGATEEQHRRAMGDQIKSKLRVLGGQGNYGIAANCHTTMTCSVALFRTLVVPNASKVTPAQFDNSTPVVVAQLDSTEQIGKIFGVSKIRNGTRLGSWSASRMDLVFLPKESSGQLRAWWTMHDY